MEVLFVILPFALLISIIFVLSFVMSVRDGQYDDLETPAYRILLDEKKQNNNNKQKNGEV